MSCQVAVGLMERFARSGDTINAAQTTPRDSLASRNTGAPSLALTLERLCEHEHAAMKSRRDLYSVTHCIDEKVRLEKCREYAIVA